MAFLGVKELTELQGEKEVISPFVRERIKNGAYELSLGKEVYLTDSKNGKAEILTEDSNRSIDINPGQFALLLTKEKVNIPKDKIAFISIKAGEKLKGLINVSGFHVDPGFNDHLLFSVYNAGPSIIVLNFGDPYFPLWFAEMKTELKAEDAYNANNGHFGTLSHIPTKYIEFLKRGELTSPKALFDKIKEVDEKAIRNDWLYKIIIGLLIAVGLKLGWDWSSYDKGYNDGKNFKFVHEQIEQKIQSPYVDSLITIKVQKILNSYKNDTTKK